MPKRFTEEQIDWMKKQRRLGHAYEQIANEFPNVFSGEEKPSASSVYNHAHLVQVLVEESIEETEDEFLEPRETPAKPISEERKKEEIEILNKFIEGKTLTDILKEKTHHHGIILRMKKVYEKDVLGDNLRRWRNLLVGSGVYDADAEDPIGAGILELIGIAGEAEGNLEDFKATFQEQKNRIFREYKEREELLKAENIKLKQEIQNKDREIRGKDLAFNKREKEWGGHVAYLKKNHANEIGRYEQEIRDIRFFETKYDAATNFAKAPDLTKEAYLKGVFNAMAILYDPHVGTKEFRRQIEKKLERATPDRDWNQFMNILMDLSRKVGSDAEEWVKRESAVVAQARDQAQQELYSKLRFFGFAGSLQDLTEAIDNYRTLPSKLKRMSSRFEELKPKVEELQLKEKFLGSLIPKLQEYQEETKISIKRGLYLSNKLIEKIQKYRNPKAYAAVKDMKEIVVETVVATEKLFTPFQAKQSLVEYLESRKRELK